MGKKEIMHTFIFLMCILIPSNVYADWDDIIITQDAQICDGEQYVRVFVSSISYPITVNVTGGQVGTLFVNDNSLVNMTGGVFSREFYSYHPENNDGDDIFLAPSIHSIYLEDSSVLNFYGADLNSVSCAHQSTTNIFSGTVSLALSGNSQINIIGGEIAGIFATKYFPDPQPASHLSIRGGTFPGKVMLFGDCVAEIYGYGFVYDPNGWVNDGLFKGTAGGQLRGFWSDGTAFSIDFLNSPFGNSYSHVVLHEVPMRIQIDIKPQSCPNPINTRSKGILNVAILGSDVLDVKEIVPDTILLEDISPIRFSYEDVSTAEDNTTECACTTDGLDGYVDLSLRFDTQELISVLDQPVDGEEWMLRLTGALYNGTIIEGSDCIIIKKKGGKNHKQ